MPEAICLKPCGRYRKAGDVGLPRRVGRRSRPGLYHQELAELGYTC